MKNLNVQFSDATESEIIAVFGCPQDDMVYPNQGIVSADDPRAVAFLGESNNLNFSH